MKLYLFTKRLIDVSVSLSVGILLLPLSIIIAVCIKLTSKGSVLFWSDRIGRGNQTFRMPKFRTMKTETPAVATHMLSNPTSHLTPIGGFMRKTSLDEIPQLWSVLIGNMTLVGPRPALYNQYDLIQSRTTLGIHTLRPGVTGWAQINGRDELSIEDKVALDAEYLKNKGCLFDLVIFFKTFLVVITSKSVSH